MQVTDWPVNQIVSHMGPAILQVSETGEPFALVTLVGKTGPSPRHVGAQMLVRGDASFLGEVSGGCVEANLALMARDAIISGSNRFVRLGEGGEFTDIRLPCGSSIDVAIEPLVPGSDVCDSLGAAIRERQPFRHAGNDDHGNAWSWTLLPRPRLLVHGHDSIAMALVKLAENSDFEVLLAGGHGFNVPEAFKGTYLHGNAAEAVDTLSPDPWTAIVTTMHDLEKDCAALVPALQAETGFVGVLGSKQHVEGRNALLATRGLSDEQIERLSAPVGLDTGAATPFGIAVSIMAEITQVFADQAS